MGEFNKFLSKISCSELEYLILDQSALGGISTNIMSKIDMCVSLSTVEIKRGLK